MNFFIKHGTGSNTARGSSTTEYVLTFGILIVVALAVGVFLSDTFRLKSEQNDSLQTTGLAPCRRGEASLIKQQVAKGDSEACL